jgi:hypothetical protein
MLQYYLAFLPLLFFAIFALLLFTMKLVDDRRWNKASEKKLLRSPGDSRRREIADIDAAINDSLMYIGVWVTVQIIAYTFLTAMLRGAILSYLVAAVSVVTVSFTIWYLVKTALQIAKRKQSSDSYFAERMTGDQLSTLILDGYRVFHDLQFDRFNIDHAIVGPAGVFAFETKHKRIRKSLAEIAKATFDGTKLKWPNGKVNELGIQDAFDRSITLKQYLGNALGGSMDVQPVLLFPGWNVESKEKGRVDIMNPKQVLSYLKGIEKYGEVIAENLINRVSRHLAEKAGFPGEKTEVVEVEETESQTKATTFAPVQAGL